MIFAFFWIYGAGTIITGAGSGRGTIRCGKGKHPARLANPAMLSISPIFLHILSVSIPVIDRSNKDRQCAGDLGAGWTRNSVNSAGPAAAEISMTQPKPLPMPRNGLHSACTFGD
ncbi:MAG: hypothetical protein JXJ18_08335 [Rhodobacteraceae bacterium]|nr:hypothetical protein [Paracoccaceae bacterium]